jgi:hypothetical protein
MRYHLWGPGRNNMFRVTPVLFFCVCVSHYWRRVPLLAILPCMTASLLTVKGELQDESKDTAMRSKSNCF